MTAQTILKGLTDIQGVIGSFVLSTGGECKLSAMPTVVGADVMSEISPRLVRLLEAFAEDVVIEGCAIRFTDHRLNVRPAGPWLLCVLSDSKVNPPTLQMAMTLVARHLVSMQFDEDKAPPKKAPATSDAASAANTASRGAMVYRGYRVPTTPRSSA